MFSASRWAAALALCALSAPAAHAQAVRGLPLFFDPTYSYETRFGLDVGNGADLGGVVWALSASHRFFVDGCASLAVTAAGGVWHRPGEANESFNGGLNASYRLNPCRGGPTGPNPTMRLVFGGGWTRVDGRTAVNVPLGGEIGYLYQTGGAQIEPWAALRAHYLEPTGTNGNSSWRTGLSLGLNFGVASSWGGRVALDFGTGRTGVSGGVSRWW